MAMRTFLAKLFLPAALAAAAAAHGFEPRVELTATLTNLVVTESASVTLHLYVPVLEPPYERLPPILRKHPPHVRASFLDLEWTSPALDVEGRAQGRLFSGAAGERRSRRDAPAFAVNDYVSDSLLSVFDDPFGMLEDDDFVGGGMLGPKRQLFAFDVSREKLGGEEAWHFSATLAPWRGASAGVVELAPATVRVPYVVGVKRGHNRFGSPTTRAEMKEVVLQTKPLRIVVSEPPAKGRPAAFCGAVASNFAVRATLDANLCTAGDPLTLTIDVSGPSDLSRVRPPSLAAIPPDSAFRADEASARTETLAQSRRFTWRVRAIKPGTVEFPALPVAWYDLATRSYKTAMTDPIPVQIKAGAQASLGALDDALDGDGAFPMPDGLALDADAWRPAPLLPRARLSLALFALAPLLFLAVRAAPPLRRRIAARAAARRRASAYPRLARALAGRDASKKAAAMRRFFEARYGVNGAAVTAADARRLMSGDFTPDETNAVANALAELEKAAFSAPKALVGILLAALALPGFAAPVPPAGDADFTYRRAMSLAIRSASQDDFAKAAKAYSDCIGKGAGSAALFADLGACAFFAGDFRASRAAFECAERRTGETPSTRRGIRAATAGLKNDPRADLPPARVFLAPHYRLSLDTRLLSAAIAWALLWVFALLPKCAARRLLMALCLTAFLAAGTSAAVSLVEDAVQKGELANANR